jgi:hypothetical protein
MRGETVGDAHKTNNLAEIPHLGRRSEKVQQGFHSSSGPFSDWKTSLATLLYAKALPTRWQQLRTRIEFSIANSKTCHRRNLRK